MKVFAVKKHLKVKISCAEIELTISKTHNKHYGNKVSVSSKF